MNKLNIYLFLSEVSSVNDGTVNAYTESDKLTNSEELQSKAEGPKSPSCQEVQKDSNCTINKSVELLHSRENDSRVTPPSPRVNKERNLFTELKLRKQYYDEQVNSAAGDENISSEVSDLNNNVNDSKSKAASGFEEDKLSEKPHTVNPKDKQSANLHSKSVGHREQRFHQKSEESSLQDNNSIAKNEPPLPGIATEAKINSTRSCDESTNNFEAADINKGVSDQVSQEKFEGHQLSREVGGGNEKMFVCCECGEKFDDENSMIMHCVDVH
ncbi:---NA--- [Paramuricea clavata]|uniref:---NA n=1 Tax=Paramuricea clavata TaxID=317549 RepID=A0A7D9LKL5_PARCT|nr:---NA--- [Paramuricea clavata]